MTRNKTDRAETVTKCRRLGTREMEFGHESLALVLITVYATTTPKSA
jgi:hypothetical protein